jgi:hypothetical protein
MPKGRKENEWARSSFYDIKLENAIKANDATDNGTGEPGPRTTPRSRSSEEAKELVRLFSEVPTNTWNGLFNYIDNLRFHRHTCFATDSDRELSWNFMPLMDEKLGTIEFRRPPGAQTAKDAQKWVVFTVAFASASLEQGWEDQWRSRKEHGTVSELQAFIKQSLMRLGHNWQNALNPEESFVEILAEADLESN